MTTKERPVVFSAQEVRAALEGRKTQFRRVVKLQPMDNPKTRPVKRESGWWWERIQPGFSFICGMGVCPFGEPGTMLWVRETWAVQHALDGHKPRFIPSKEARVHYAASEDRGGLLWRSQIQMPRWASRITLEVTDIRVERLQDISDEDAIAEGMQRSRANYWCGAQHRAHAFPRQMKSAKAAYADLWDSAYAKTAPWENNPWVWRVEFRRV